VLGIVPVYYPVYPITEVLGVLDFSKTHLWYTTVGSYDSGTGILDFSTLLVWWIQLQRYWVYFLLWSPKKNIDLLETVLMLSCTSAPRNRTEHISSLRTQLVGSVPK
jgi:hypothetical protein